MFYATLVYGEYDEKIPPLHDLPDGVIIYFTKKQFGRHWYLKDLTPVLLEDVPVALKTMVLLMGYGHG